VRNRHKENVLKGLQKPGTILCAVLVDILKYNCLYQTVPYTEHGFVPTRLLRILQKLFEKIVTATILTKEQWNTGNVSPTAQR
jgi:hypothetical protein